MTTEELEKELREMRSEPDPDFSRRLDEWAAADFPPDAGLGPRIGSRRRAGGSFRRAWQRIATVPPRRVLMPVGAVATVAVVAAVAISRNDDQTFTLSEPTVSETAPEAAREFDDSSAAGAQGAAEGPAVQDQAAAAPSIDSGGAGGIASGSETRIVDATARLSLGTEASKVQDVANDVVSVTDSYDGIVLDSRVTTDQAGARADFSLEIPYKRLDAALTDLSGLADVISRTEGGEDITSRATRSQRDLASTLEQIRKARIALIEADTRQDKLVIRSQIDSLNASADAYRAELNAVKRQGRFATVDVEVSSDGPDSGSGGGWSLGDAFRDAGRVLEVIAGVGLVTLAVMLPISLIALLGWAIAARTAKRRREAVLN